MHGSVSQVSPVQFDCEEWGVNGSEKKKRVEMIWLKKNEKKIILILFYLKKK